MSNYHERTVVRQETRVVDFGKLNDSTIKQLHEQLIRDGYFREHPAIDDASDKLGPGRVTYKKWLENSE